MPTTAAVSEIAHLDDKKKPAYLEPLFFNKLWSDGIYALLDMCTAPEIKKIYANVCRANRRSHASVKAIFLELTKKLLQEGKLGSVDQLGVLAELLGYGWKGEMWNGMWETDMERMIGRVRSSSYMHWRETV